MDMNSYFCKFFILSLDPIHTCDAWPIVFPSPAFLHRLHTFRILLSSAVLSLCSDLAMSKDESSLVLRVSCWFLPHYPGVYNVHGFCLIEWILGYSSSCHFHHNCYPHQKKVNQVVKKICYTSIAEFTY